VITLPVTYEGFHLPFALDPVSKRCLELSKSVSPRSFSKHVEFQSPFCFEEWQADSIESATCKATLKNYFRSRKTMSYAWPSNRCHEVDADSVSSIVVTKLVFGYHFQSL
jgi:hypothetical protein